MPDPMFPMPAISWFIATASVAAIAWALGVVIGRSNIVVSRAALLAGIAGLLTWGYLMRNQDVAVQLLPVSFLSRIEGVAAVPLFMLIVGIAWSRSSVSRQRHIVAWAMVVGCIYFVHGGWWMTQATPAMGSSRTYGDGYVLQTEDYTCVAAASATALNRLGIPATEAEMVGLTLTRSGTGATTLRAMAALEQKLKGTEYQVDLISPGFDELHRIALPALTPLQFDVDRRHMVAILHATSSDVTIADPAEGTLHLNREEFETVYRGQVLVICRRD